jgi:hypothetical protein
MMQAGHVACMGKLERHTEILRGKLNGSDHFGEDINMYLKDMI